jgi:excisionase family DNA binding protein
MTKDEITQTLKREATISVLDAGAVLGLSKSTAYAAAHSGDLPTIRVGKRFLVPTEKLAEMLGLKPELAA